MAGGDYCTTIVKKLIINHDSFRLPSKLYPEYHSVHQMMAGTTHNPGYRALAMSQILEIREDGGVKILLGDSTEIVIKVTNCKNVLNFSLATITS